MEYGVFFAHLKRNQARELLPLPVLYQRLALARDHGVKGVTMATDELTPEWLEAVRSLGLRVDTVYHVCRIIHGQPMDPAVPERVAATGAKMLMIVPGFCEEGDDPESYLPAAAPLLSDAVRRCEELGLSAGIENYGGRITPYSTAEGLKRYCDAVDGLKMIFDVGNFLYHNEEPLAAWDLLRPYAVQLHGKDLSRTPLPGVLPSLSPLGFPLYPTSIGFGAARPFYLRLREEGFDGILTLEYDGNPDLPRFLRESTTFLNHTH